MLPRRNDGGRPLERQGCKRSKSPRWRAFLVSPTDAVRAGLAAVHAGQSGLVNHRLLLRCEGSQTGFDRNIQKM
jgi:hypothetical protein